MSYNETLLNKVREALAHLPKVEEKKMFSGLAFMVDDKMCIAVSADRAMFRIDPEIHDELLETKTCRPMIMKGREYKGYIVVDEDELKRKKELDYWVSLALAFNPWAKATTKKK